MPDTTISEASVLEGASPLATYEPGRFGRLRLQSMHRNRLSNDLINVELGCPHAAQRNRVASVNFSIMIPPLGCALVLRATSQVLGYSIRSAMRD